MTISIDTLRDLAAVDPYKETGPRPISPRDEFLAHLDAAGMLPFMARKNLAPSKGQDDHLWYYPSRDGNGYLRADIMGRVDSTKITEAAIKRVAQDDQELAKELNRLRQEQGGAAVFQRIDAQVRRHDLAQLATPRTADLASTDEYMSQRNRGRAM
ncbi:hypothetical protein [Pseudomonas sp. Hp2]|uniref:hypothetical protein n=1 Tax=Pseudomonas sp. Hp2 TaxID=701189 RepID=UPI00112E6BCD|nr:hypothetical protein [Pseudomonas sp. Hp2]